MTISTLVQSQGKFEENSPQTENKQKKKKKYIYIYKNEKTQTNSEPL